MSGSWPVFVCSIAVLASLADAWTCGITLIGDSAVPRGLTFSKAVVNCTRGDRESTQTLKAWIHPALRSVRFEGVSPQEMPPDTNQPLLWFEQDNVTFRDVQLVNIDAYNMCCILSVRGSNNTFEGLQSTACNAQSAIVDIKDTSNGIDTSTLINHSSCTNSTTRAFSVYNSNVTVTNSVFDGLSTALLNGGAIVVNNTDGSSMSLHNCSFVNNAATSSDDGYGTGGAIYHVGPHLFLNNTSFESNTCSTYGGAVQVDSVALLDGSWADDEELLVQNCSFKNNTSKGNGGAINYSGSNGQNTETMCLNGTQFDGNTAPSGGALYLDGVANVLVYQTIFERNVASSGLGGGIYTYGQVDRVTDIYIFNSLFQANNATNLELDAPADIFDEGECAGAHLLSCGCVGIYNTTFEDNIGIGLCLRDVSGECEVDPGDTSTPPIGPLFQRQTIETEDDVGSFDNFLGRSDDGIIISVDIRQCTFRRNVAASQLRNSDEPMQPRDPLAGAAALDLLSIPYSVLADSVFEENVGRQGSAAHLDSCTAVVMWNDTFDGNVATHEGGAIVTVNSHGKGILLGASKLRNNVALVGGAIYGGSGSSITITNSTSMSNNSAVTNGGAISCSGCQAVAMQNDAAATLNQAGNFGGACHCVECNTFQVHNVNLTANSAASGGALYIDGSMAASVTLTNITNTLLKSNRAAKTASYMDGGAMYLAGGVSTTYNTSFVNNNAAQHGGAIAYRHQCFDFASLPGGMRSMASAYLWEGFSTQTHKIAALAGQCSLLKSDSDSFMSNFAIVAGGAIYATNMTSLKLLCSGAEVASSTTACDSWADNGVQVQQNGSGVALQGYGPALAFVPATISLKAPSKAAHYVSNGNSKLPMTIQVRDQAGNLISSALSVSSPLRAMVGASALDPGQPAPLLQGQTQETALRNGTINISELSLLARPGNYTVSVTLPDYPLVPAASMLVHVRPCIVGEIQSTPETCTACLASTFSFASNHTACDACPANANCTGAAKLVPNPQYWHSAPNSDFMVQCPNSKACQGNREELSSCKQQAYMAEADPTQAQGSCDLMAGMDSTDSNAYMVKQCSEGYYGPVCSMCLKGGGPNATRYGRTSTTQCQQCRRSGVIVLTYAVSTVLVICWLIFTIQITLQENQEVAEGVDTIGRTTEFIKALTLWLQYIMLLGSVNISVPDSVHWVFSAASFAFSTVTSGALSIDCLQSGKTNAAVQRVCIHLAVPIMVLLILIILQTIWWWRAKPAAASVADPISSPSISSSSMTSPVVVTISITDQPRSTPLLSLRPAELRRRLLVTFVTVIFYYYPSLLTTSLSLFACYRIDPLEAQMGQNYPQNAQANWRWGYWVPDMTVRCYHSWHLGFSVGLGVPLLLLVAMVVPFLPIFLLFKHRTQLAATSVKLRLGFVYHSYRAQFWFWDSIILLQTLALAAAQVFATSLDAYFQLTIMLLVLIIGFALLAHYQPFEDPSSQATQVLGLLIVVATATGCLYFLDPNEVASNVGLNATGILLLILNLGFVALMAVLISKRGRPVALRWIARLQSKCITAIKSLCGLLRLPWSWKGSSSSTTNGLSNASGTSAHLGLLPFTFRRSNTSAESDLVYGSQSGQGSF